MSMHYLSARIPESLVSYVHAFIEKTVDYNIRTFW